MSIHSPHTQPAALGLDFGTESVRVLIVDLQGRELGVATEAYELGQIVDRLPTTQERLPVDFALQHPSDWMKAATKATRQAISVAGIAGEQIIGIGVDFTSCTMFPTRSDGTPLCLTPEFSAEKYAWPKLWKHHAAKQETDRINTIAHRRGERFLARYGGVIGLEWFFPKVLETLNHAEAAYEAADVWVEAGDWIVWQLVGGTAKELPRSTCQAGYKGMWSARDGFPSAAFLDEVHPKLADVVGEKMPGRLCPPGSCVGGLVPAWADRMGIPAGTPVSAAIIDAHAAVPGVGAAEPGVMVMVMGTSACHMLNATKEQSVPGIAGIVKDGILPGLYGYETGQAAVGDAFDWVRRLAGHGDFSRLSESAARLPQGSDGVACIDWFNGCRTPFMDGRLSGQYSGLKLHHDAGHLYRATMEATAYGLRWIVDLLREHSVPVTRFVASGGLPHHNPLLVQIYADVLGEPVEVHPSKQGPALGAAILGALAGAERTGFRSMEDAIRSMTGDNLGSRHVEPNRQAVSEYAHLYQHYRRQADRLRQEQNFDQPLATSE
ncbi:ribulokinase [Planctomicrobium sp. SH661]|uniref:ribulokinase n=1 Tax=Planctomicrobium sp. SH661 TaxID=3448124 RepID=UPI003F5BF31D